MEQFFKDPQTLLPMHDGPLGNYIGSFARRLTDQGYARYSIHYQLRLVAGFNRWLEQEGIPVSELTPEHIKRYLQYRAQRLRPRSGDAAPLERLLDLLWQDGAIEKKETPIRRTSTQQVVDEFGLYLRQERALASATITYYLDFVGRFLIDRFADGKAELAALCAADIVRFVQDQAARLRPKRAKQMTSALRAFFQYARYRGDLNLDLAAAVPAVADWTKSSIPKFLPPDQIELVLAHCNRQTAIGRRDYAILLLLARLGLRGGEVAALMLDDIDWESGYISVCGKGRRQAQLPLPVEVGEAITAYLKNGRPSSADRRLFLRGRAPAIGFRGSVAISSLVMHALKRAGIKTPHQGAHLFRHSLATRMLGRGASLAEIGELLRHQSPQTTTIYAKVDLGSLRTLALPWPGGEL
jgi:integrase/recombinase XerD